MSLNHWADLDQELNLQPVGILTVDNTVGRPYQAEEQTGVALLGQLNRTGLDRRLNQHRVGPSNHMW
jgi:hypothetical protein